jgi:hypothetical protein
MNDEYQMPDVGGMPKHEARSRSVSCLRVSGFGLLSSFVIRHSSFLLLLLAAVASSSAMSGTTQVAWPGKPVTAEADWPAGTVALLNDPLRAAGWNPWFSEWPNDVNHYEFKPRTTNDVNRLVAGLAAIKSDRLCLILSPEQEPRGLGFTTRLPASNGVAAVFALGSQQRIDQWYPHLLESSPGVRKFGVHTFSEAPKATPPTLTLYVGSPAIDLTALSVPANVQVTGVKPAADDPDPARRSRAQAIEEFIASLKRPAGSRTPRSGARRRRALRPLYTNRKPHAYTATNAHDNFNPGERRRHECE